LGASILSPRFTNPARRRAIYGFLAGAAGGVTVEWLALTAIGALIAGLSAAIIGPDGGLVTGALPDAPGLAAPVAPNPKTAPNAKFVAVEDLG